MGGGPEAPGDTAGKPLPGTFRVASFLVGSPVEGDSAGDDAPPNSPDLSGSGRLSVVPLEPFGISIVTLVARRGGRLIPVPDDSKFDAGSGKCGVLAGRVG